MANSKPALMLPTGSVVVTKSRSSKSSNSEIIDALDADERVAGQAMGEGAEGVVLPDGRQCSICLHYDTDNDICFVARFWPWGYAPIVIKGVLRNVGKTCFYCMRVFQAKYHPKHKIKGMPNFLGGDDKEHTKFFKHVVYCQEQGRNHTGPLSELRITWPNDEKILHNSEILDLWEEPDDLYIPTQDYLQQYGDPATNGLGHRSGTNKHGVMCIIVPESNVMRTVGLPGYDSCT